MKPGDKILLIGAANCVFRGDIFVCRVYDVNKNSGAWAAVHEFSIAGYRAPEGTRWVGPATNWDEVIVLDEAG